MPLLSFKTTFDTFSFYPSQRLSYDPALKPYNTNRNSKPKLKLNRKTLIITTVLSYNDPEYNGPLPFLNYKINNWLQFLANVNVLRYVC